MALFPPLELGWANGWIPLVLFYLVFGVLLASFTKDVVARLYDRTGWSDQEKRLAAVGKLPIFACFLLLVFTPLKLGTPLFLFGSVVYTLGLGGMVVALLNYSQTPPNEPVTKGIYKISRNPQAVTILISMLGMCLVIGSWTATILMVIASVFSHLRILAEEKSCLAQYGDSYQSYMQRVPRYLLLF
jgi:protein-S-isoprenylcysteine O-methyltransferase Ste14